MNKILVNNKKNNFLEMDQLEFLENDTLFLEIEDRKKDLFLVVKDDVCVTLNILAHDVDFSFHIKLGEHSSLSMNVLIIEGNMNIDASLEGEYANFSFCYSTIASKDSYNQIEVNHNQNHTTSKLCNHGFSLSKAALVFDVSARIPKEASNCISNQDNQIIQKEDSLSKINPNLYIDNYNVEASHSAYVGEFKEQELFYLMSRGISKEESEVLLLKAFLLGNLELTEELKEEYEKTLLEYFK